MSYSALRSRHDYQHTRWSGKSGWCARRCSRNGSMKCGCSCSVAALLAETAAADRFACEVALRITDDMIPLHQHILHTFAKAVGSFNLMRSPTCCGVGRAGSDVPSSADIVDQEAERSVLMGLNRVNASKGEHRGILGCSLAAVGLLLRLNGALMRSQHAGYSIYLMQHGELI